MHRSLRLGLAVALSIGALAVGARADGPAGPAGAGVPTSENLEHVFNHRMDASARNPLKGTDIEFYASTVPVRDAAGQIVRDETGAPLTHERDFAVVGDYGDGAYIYDITNPEAPALARFILCPQIQNDPQLKRFGDRWLLALTSDQSARPCFKSGIKSFGATTGGVAVFDVTDPVTAVELFRFGATGGGHNFTWHPTKPYGWMSTGDLPGGRNHLPIVDFSDLTDVKLVNDLLSPGGPHDLSFNADGTRAYVASENNYRIYDSTDPANPTLVSVVPTDGTYAHTLEPTPDGRIMVGTEESLALGGFFHPGTTVCPGEGITFFGIEGTQELAPTPLGHYIAPVAGHLGAEDARACTAHQGKIAANSHVIVLGWYVGGVRVVDFSNPAMPRELGHIVADGTEVWSARFYKGPYIYAGDQQRGFDVYKWSGEGLAPWLVD